MKPPLYLQGRRRRAGDPGSAIRFDRGCGPLANLPGRPEGDHAERHEEALWLRSAMASLPDRDRLAVTLRYGLNGSPPMIYREIGRELGLCQDIAKQVLLRGLATLRETAETLNPYRFTEGTRT